MAKHGAIISNYAGVLENELRKGIDIAICAFIPLQQLDSMKNTPFLFFLILRQQLLAQRQALPNRLTVTEPLQRVMRLWLLRRNDVTIGAYWPIKGEFDPLPALHRWKEDGELLEESQRRRIGLPVVDKEHKTLKFHAWYPGCPMEEDAYGIPKPKETEIIVPTLLFVPCVGYGPGGYRLGYGGGFYDRTLAAVQPHPYTGGLSFAHGFIEDLMPESHDIALDAILNENGAVWPLD